MLRRLLVLFASLVAAALLAEGAARVFLRLRGAPYDSRRADETMSEILSKMTEVVPETPGGGAEVGEEDRPEKGIHYALHPYTAFTTTSGLGMAEGAVSYFKESHDPAELTVFFMGGSVAAIVTGMESGAFDRLASALEADPRLGGRKVRMWRLAIPGWKQPQQLTLLAYLLSRGCRPDLVINLDGVNEVRIGPRNAQLGVQPTWPSIGHWSRVTEWEHFDPEGLELLVDVGVAQRRALALVESARRWHVARSAVLGRVVLSRLARARVAPRVAHLVETQRESANRPFGVAPKPEGALQESVDCWLDSSLAMHNLCEPLGVRYVHLLQPTLHDEGSKPVTEEEIRKGIGERGYDRRVSEGYPLLREGCARLAERGVRCFDLSMLFAGVEETLYYDDCHFGRKGNQLLADRIFELLAGIL